MILDNVAFSHESGWVKVDWKEFSFVILYSSDSTSNRLLCRILAIFVHEYLTALKAVTAKAAEESSRLTARGCWLTNWPKCEHTLEQSYSGMYSIFHHTPPSILLPTATPPLESK